jgi:hypothetical protein
LPTSSENVKHDGKSGMTPNTKGLLKDAQLGTEAPGKHSHASNSHIENDENSSELANNSGGQGLNQNIGDSHIFGQFGTDLSAANDPNGSNVSANFY